MTTKLEWCWHAEQRMLRQIGAARGLLTAQLIMPISQRGKDKPLAGKTGAIRGETIKMGSHSTLYTEVDRR